MARISGIDLPREKGIETALTYLFGIGRSRASKIVTAAKVDPRTKVKELSEVDVAAIREVIDKNFRVEGDLRSETQRNVKRLMDIGCYRGLRHRKGLPVRGQRTHTNARTRKGGRRTAGKKG